MSNLYASEMFDDDGEPLSSYVDYCDRPMSCEDQAAYDAYRAREQYNVALAMMLAASQRCVDTAAEGVAAWKAVTACLTT